MRWTLPSFFGANWWGVLCGPLSPEHIHAVRTAQAPARSEPDGEPPARGIRPYAIGRIDPVRGGPGGAGDRNGAAGGSQGRAVLPFARRQPGTAPVKVWLHPRLSDAQAQSIADSLGCRMTWKGRGVALVPLGDA
ncbi:MAG: hypothetical protein Q8M53_10855 [Burkholderiales bacterium]|nr:hypothetical protein [Burkholderiales bacterium]